MSELSRDTTRLRYARPGDDNMVWTLGAIGVIIVLGFAYFGIGGPYKSPATPAPVVHAPPLNGVPATSLIETTGQSLPRAQ
jgi:hypothetical protein